MSLAESLADAVLETRRLRYETQEQERALLLAERAELQRLAASPHDAATLERRRQSLEQSLAALTRQRADLEQQHDEISTELAQMRRRLWERLTLLCRELIAEAERERASQSFESAMAAFADDLARAGVEVGHTTPALLRRQLPRLQEAARAARVWAQERAREVSVKLSESAAHVEQHERLEAKRQRVRRETAEVLAHLSASHRAEQMALVEEIRDADARVLRRLRREVLDPLLSDACWERVRSFAGDDPLLQLESLRNP